jgi:hypothetical protein
MVLSRTKPPTTPPTTQPRPPKTTPTTVTTTAAPLAAIEVLASDALIDLGNDLVVATIGARPDVLREDGSASQSGDVLSVQRDGTLQARPEGSAGSFEVARKTAAGLIYRPASADGSPGRCYLVPCALAVPQ